MRVPMDPRPAPAEPGCRALVERRPELAAIADRVAGLGRGEGGVVVIEAVAGLGKTALLEAAVRAAREAGAQVLSARARHLETEAPFELLRRLLGPAVHRCGGAEALTGAAAFAAPLFRPGAELAPGIDYGCQWLVSALAERAPLLLAIDDAHWADAASLRVLRELAADIADQPVLLAVAARPVENERAQPLLSALVIEAGATLLRPAPLTAAGVRAVVADVLGSAAEPTFVAAAARASGGNAFYLREIVRGAAAPGGRGPDAAAAAELDGAGSDILGRSLRVRLGELGPRATALAQAAAILGDGCPLAHAAELAGLELLPAAVLAGRLTAATVLATADPVGFGHPLVRAGVEATLAPGAVGALHARAAALRRERSAPVAQVLHHLVAAPPAGDARVCRVLYREALSNLDAGSVLIAHQLLDRAMAEPPPPELRGEVLLALARAERATGHLTEAAAHLTEAAGTAGFPLTDTTSLTAGGHRGPAGAAADGPDASPVAVAAVGELFDVLFDLGRQAEFAALHRRALALAPYGDRPEEIRLRARLLNNVSMGAVAAPPPELAGVEPAKLPVRTGEDRHLLISAALFRRAASGGSTEEFLRQLRRAAGDLAGRRPLGYWDTQAALDAATFLAANEAMDEADDILRAVTADVARYRGVAPNLQTEWNNRVALNRLRRGQFEEAAAGLAEAEAFAARHGPAALSLPVLYVRGWIRLERGDYAAAGELLLRCVTDDPVTPALGELLSGRPGEALRILGDRGFAIEPEAAARSIEIQLEPHLIASHAHGILGDREAARAEAERELALRRRYGPPFRLALALRRAASFLPARAAVPVLAEAAALAGGTPRLPVRARVGASYGSALRRANRLPEARVELAKAIDVAVRLGMDRLRDRATAELQRAGGRPRRTRVTGVEALTDSQRAVVERAAKGRTNRQIAEELYVSVKTVETHLVASYRKLDIGGRPELAEALSRA